MGAPIWIIFTKCDKLSEGVTAQMLEEKIPQLFNAAISNNTSKIYKKGLNVKSYASQAMGKWQDDTMPPFDYKPINVLEPIIRYVLYHGQEQIGSCQQA